MLPFQRDFEILVRDTLNINKNNKIQYPCAIVGVTFHIFSNCYVTVYLGNKTIK